MLLTINHDINTIINWFEEYCIDERGYGERTSSQYVSIIESYLKTSSNNKIDLSSPELYTEEKIQEFRKIFTSKLTRAALSSFSKFLYEKEFINETLYKITFGNAIKNAFPIVQGEVNRVQEFLSPHDIRILFSDTLQYSTEEEKYIFPLVIGLSYFCLFNQKELEAIDIKDVDLENKLIKNIRERNNINFSPSIKVNNLLFKLLSDYLVYRKKAYPRLNSSKLLIFKGKAVNNSALNATLYGIPFNKKNKGLLKTDKINTGLLIKSSILYMLRYSKNTLIIELSQLIGTNFFSTKYFTDAFEEFRKNELELKDSNEVLLFDLESNLPKIINKSPSPLVNEDIINTYDEKNDITQLDVEEYDMKNDLIPSETKVVIQRLVRNSKVANNLKELYKNKCLLCETSLRKSDGTYYSEAHHIHPYNKIHRGSDQFGNMIILCSNCHTQFDDSYYSINPETLLIHCLFDDDDKHQSRVALKHTLSKDSLEYAWQLFLAKKS